MPTLQPKLHSTGVSSAHSMPQALTATSRMFVARPPRPALSPLWTLSIGSDPSTYPPFGTFPPRSTLLSSPPSEAYYWPPLRAKKRPISTARGLWNTDGRCALVANLQNSSRLPSIHSIRHLYSFGASHPNHLLPSCRTLLPLLLEDRRDRDQQQNPLLQPRRHHHHHHYRTTSPPT